MYLEEKKEFIFTYFKKPNQVIQERFYTVREI